jgi:hypothetical protein
MSMTSAFKKIACAGAAIALVAACSSPANDDLPSDSTSAVTAPTHHAHIMPLRSASPDRRVEAAPAGSHLKYYGGPVLQNVKVFNVFWKSTVRYQNEMNAFYPAVLNSNYMDWLNEYDTAGQHIGRGSFAGSYVDPSAPSGSTITNDQIQAELSRLLDSSAVPANDGQNMLYMFYFPSGVKIQLDPNTSSCVQFCAYHNTYTHGGKNVYYGVMPDVNAGACSFGCGTAGGAGNLTAVSSHELIEAVTDGAVGLVQGDQPVAPLAWYDTTNGEIGDICVGQMGNVAGQAVQLEWSNFENACIATRRSCSAGCGTKTCGQDGCGNPCGFCPSGKVCGSGGSCEVCTPSCAGKTCGDDGCGGSCGTCASGSSCDAAGHCGACTPTCDGQHCGQQDGCGGTCGCPSGHTCIPSVGICF